MVEISLCMIVKDEGKTLGNCLCSIADLVDEIVIIDTGSMDQTKNLAAGYTDKIYDFEWVDDFSAARNFSFSKATKDYCMWLDADDILKDEDRRKFLSMKKELSSDVDAVFMPYHCEFTQDGYLEVSFLRERIVRREAGFKWYGRIHETMKVSGNIVHSNVAVTHTKRHFDSHRNLLILESIVKGNGEDPKILFYYASELYEHDRLEEAMIAAEKFFRLGWYESGYCLNMFLLLFDIYLRKDEHSRARELANRCIPFCADRSEFCSRLGYFYVNIIKDMNEAIYWFGLALKCPYPSEIGQIALDQYYYYIPYFQLGNIYCRMNKLEDGLRCLRRAMEYRPRDPELTNIIDKLSAIIIRK